MSVSNRLQNAAFLQVGFRPFFIGAAAFAIISALSWASVYIAGYQLSTAPLSILQWHAHEMIYGYAMAVVTGFLLTAVSIWTGLPTCRGGPLLMLFGFWVCARALYLFGSQFLLMAALSDLLFLSMLCIFVFRPVIKTRQWGRMAILGKLLLLLIFSLVFLLGATGVLESGARLGVYGGFYLLISLVLTVGRKVIPSFIERGVGYPVVVGNAKWLDISSLALFLLFFVLELTRSMGMLSAWIALALCAVNVIRLWSWHTTGIWKKPLLWGLYLSYCFICLGFLLFFIAWYFSVSKFIAIHALAFGGIGTITLSMMSRVALGHTGRDIADPPRGVTYALIILIAGALIRVFPPMLDAAHYVIWIGLSQTLWITAFAIFLWIYAPMLIRPRIDER